MNLNPADSHAKYSKCVEKSLSRLLQPLFLWLNVLHCKNIFTVFVQYSFISVKFTFQLFCSLKKLRGKEASYLSWKFSCGKVPQHWTLLTQVINDHCFLFVDHFYLLLMFMPALMSATLLNTMAWACTHTFCYKVFIFFFCTPWSCVVSSIDFFGLQLYRSIACSTVITRNLLAPFSSATRLATQYL